MVDYAAQAISEAQLAQLNARGYSSGDITTLRTLGLLSNGG